MVGGVSSSSSQPMTMVIGVLLGAGDAAFMRTATVVSALIGFLPLTWLSLAFGWGLAGIWAGLSAFIALRLILGIWRVRSGTWLGTEIDTMVVKHRKAQP